jgi:hypothetical protein
MKDELKKLFKKEIGYGHLESKCAGNFVDFDLVHLHGPANTPECTNRKISVFEGSASVGGEVGDPGKVMLSFDPDKFTLDGIRLNCRKCERRTITLPLGQSSGYELFLFSEGSMLESNGKCKCLECTMS